MWLGAASCSGLCFWGLCTFNLRQWWYLGKNKTEVENPTSPCAGLRALCLGCRTNLPFFVPWDFCFHGHTVVCSQFQGEKSRKSLFILEIACSLVLSARRWWVCARAPPAEQIFQARDTTLQHAGKPVSVLSHPSCSLSLLLWAVQKNCALSRLIRYLL